MSLRTLRRRAALIAVLAGWGLTPSLAGAVGDAPLPAAPALEAPPQLFAEPAMPAAVAGEPVLASRYQQHPTLAQGAPADAAPQPQADKAPVAASQLPAPVPRGPQRVSLREFAAMIASSDELIRVQRIEQNLGDESVRAAKAAFEPFAFVGVEREGSRVLNTAIDAKQRGLNPGDVYSAQESRLKTGVQAKSTYGTDWELSYNLSRIRNTIQPLANAPSPEHKGYLGVKLTQPLMRGFGKDVNQLPIQIAEAERQVATETVRQLTAQRLMEAINQYLLVQRAEERVRLRAQVHQMAAAIEKAIVEQHIHGLRSAAELNEARATLALRQAQLAQAQQDLEEQSNLLQNYLTAGERAEGAPLVRSMILPELLPATSLSEQQKLDAERQRVDNAFDRRPEARMSQLRIDREGKKVLAAQDQTRPELNVTMRYGKEDLSANYREMPAYFGTRVPYNSWMVGLFYRVGLFGDEKKDAEYKQALLRRNQAELGAAAVKQRIVNEVAASAAVLERAVNNLSRQREIVQAQRTLVTIDEQLMREGRKSSIDLAKRRAEQFTAEEALGDAQTQASRAAFQVTQADGSLLALLGLE